MAAPGRLRKVLERPGVVVTPCCHDALSARLIERAGFEAAFLSGFSASAARLGQPDVGLATASEMADVARACAAATALPIIGDGDTGHGNALNVRRTVELFARAGLAGIMLEDQEHPKACGHVRQKRVVGRAECVARIKAAADAAGASAAALGGEGVAVVGRTDARQAPGLGLEEALWRVEAFADLGADLLFIDALESREEMARLCAVGRKYGVPVLANMLEGGGKTPILSLQELEDLGFKVVAYPLSLLSASVRAMQDALRDLRHGWVPQEPAILSFPALQETLGFPEYFKAADEYDAFSRAYLQDVDDKGAAPAGDASSEGQGGGGDAGPEEAAPAEEAVPVMEAEVVEASTGSLDEWLRSGVPSKVEAAAGSGRLAPAEAIRVIVTNEASGKEELNVRLPSAVLGIGGVSGVKAAISMLAGLQESLLEEVSLNVAEALGSQSDDDGVLLDARSGDYRIRVLEE